jgi:hypothetical protein
MEKVSLPIKTKIAAWWIIIFGWLIIIFNAIICSSYLVRAPKIAFKEPTRIILPYITAIFLGLFLYTISFYFLLKRKKLGWVILIIILSIISILALFFPETRWSEFPIPSLNLLCLYCGIFAGNFGWRICLFIPFGIPLIFLLLDRKNFWKITS